MVVRKDDLHNLIDRLQEPDQKTAFDFLQYLIERSERKPLRWEEIDRQEPDDEPLSEEELRQLKSDARYVSGEDAKRISTSYKLTYHKDAVKFIAKQVKTQERIAQGLKGLLAIPPSGDIKPMRG